MRVLITGACGFVGRYLGDYLSDLGMNVLGGTYSSAVENSGGPISFETVQLDITDRENCAAVVQEYSPEVIFHLAGISFVPQAAADFETTLRVNVHGVYNLCEAAHGLERKVQFVLASSGEVYGKITPLELPITEHSRVQPKNAYSLSKVMAEEVVQYFGRLGFLEGYIFRPFNHIGPGQNESFVTASFASQLAKIAHQLSEPVIKVGNLQAERDFMDVRDVVRAYHLALDKSGGTYNLSSGTSVSIQALLDILIDLSGLEVTIEQDSARMRPSEVPEIRGSFEKAFRELDWKPEIDIESSLRDIYAYWYDKHSP